jgi:hypothetical protein
MVARLPGTDPVILQTGVALVLLRSNKADLALSGTEGAGDGSNDSSVPQGSQTKKIGHLGISMGSDPLSPPPPVLTMICVECASMKIDIRDFEESIL